MSVTFFIPDSSHPEHELNVSNANARSILEWLGYSQEASGDLCGEMPARALAARCQRRLWPEARNVDAGVAPEVVQTPGRATLVECGRDAGYLNDRTQKLLHLATAAGTGVVHFG